MEELEFSRRDLEGLAAKLVRAGLTEGERALLLAIFWVAAERVSPVLPQASEDPGELHKQLVESFIPDTGSDFLIHVQKDFKHGPGGPPGQGPWGTGGTSLTAS